jgi:hypothetical protein
MAFQTLNRDTLRPTHQIAQSVTLPDQSIACDCPSSRPVNYFVSLIV